MLVCVPSVVKQRPVRSRAELTQLSLSCRTTARLSRSPHLAMVSATENNRISGMEVDCMGVSSTI